MDLSRLLFLIFTLMSPSECSEPAKLQCVESDIERFVILEGEAFYIMPYDLTETYYPDEEFTWYKNDSQISNDESKNVHYHGGALYFLNVSAEDSGFYHARCNYSSGNCSNHYVKIKVVDDINQALYRGEENSHGSLRLYCPDTVKVICNVFKGELSWMKDLKLLQGQKEDLLLIENTVKEDEGIYTCTCTWEHNQRVYKSSGSRRLKTEQPAKLQCVESDIEIFDILEGEAFYIMPYDLTETYYPDEEFTWYKNDSQISNDESKNVHYHGGALYFLNVSAEDSGFYHARRNYLSGKCSNHYVKIKVVDDINQALYRGEENSHGSLRLYCPDPVKIICDVFKGELSWMKDLKLLQGQKEDLLLIENTVKEDEGIYTCTCTWEHNQRVYKSSGSRRLKTEDPFSHRVTPLIISPAEKELFVDEGYGITLNCTVLCGTNVKLDCHARWEPVNGTAFEERHGYHVNTSVGNKERYNTYATAVLTIDRVSSKDLQTEFKCIGKGFYNEAPRVLKLNGRASIALALAIRGACVLFIAVLAAVLVKCFAIDLTLCFRRYCPRRSQIKDVGMYDAYVVYQMQSMDKANEETLCQFITNHLPSVLEEKCGYRLFIHGRDDIPGEDHLELVEARMKQSRRLMVILTPGSGSGCDITDQHPVSPHTSMIEGFDWQLGLHHALVQREMSVILIEIGDVGREGYNHLLPGLQHLILHRAPIRWPKGSRGAGSWNSRFWKRVRFQMPATPANKCSQSAII